MMSPRTLILLPCHSIWKFYNNYSDVNPGQSQLEWSLLSFQIESQDHLLFIDHIKTAVSRLDSDSVVVISGGATKSDTGPVSELQSYYYLGQTLGLINDSNKGQIILENFARDSMENLVFSLVRFYNAYHSMPEKVMIVGLEFKRLRFLQNHAKFLKLDVEYIGNNPILINESEEVNEKFLQDTMALEIKHAVRHFEKDPLGIASPLLDKKSTRDPYHSGGELNYALSCSEITMQDILQDTQLLEYYTPDTIDSNKWFCKLYKFIQFKL